MRLIAHRGFADVYPENTVGAVSAAGDVADLVEVDVRRCASGQPVVVHDQTVDRVTDGTGRVDELSLSTLRELDVLGSGEPIPTLWEVLDAASPAAGLNVELKDPDLARSIAERLADEPVEVLVSSFRADALAAVASVAADLPTALLFASDPNERLQQAVDLDCAAVHPRADLCTPAFVERTHAAGLTVNAWTVDDDATAARLREAGVDGIIADRPDVAGGAETTGRRR
ncbi:MAG: glycerophosphodiester phosphodiesterase family protein [Halobacteriales archaeon]